MTAKKFYIGSLCVLLIVSIYPLYMGFNIVGAYLKNGFVQGLDYQKYVIPYTPICMALIITVGLMPAIKRLYKRNSLLVASILAMVLFLAFELGFEQIQVKTAAAIYTVDSWQLSLCMATPQVLKTVGLPLYASDNPAFKVHFYMIAIVIIVAVINVIYGFFHMLKNQSYDKKLPLIAQAASVIIFISLCVYACFTAFYRNGTIHISVLSATLMSIFFIVFGLTVGVYTGGIFYKKSKFFSLVIPSLMSALITVAMYIGELILMGGVLYKYGNGPLFEPLGGMPFAVVDIAVIMSSGGITYFVLFMLLKLSSEK